MRQAMIVNALFFLNAMKQHALQKKMNCTIVIESDHEKSKEDFPSLPDWLWLFRFPIFRLFSCIFLIQV